MGTYDCFNVVDYTGKYPYKSFTNMEEWRNHNVYIDVEDIYGIKISIGDPAPINRRELSFAESFCLWADLISYILAVSAILLFCVILATI
jgi:hypothetical protein